VARIAAAPCGEPSTRNPIWKGLCRPAGEVRFPPIADIWMRATLAVKMARQMAAFASLFFTGLVAGAAFVIWIEFNPAGLSASFYVQSMQHAIRDFTVPLPAIVMLSVVSTASASFLYRREGRSFYLLLAAFICTVLVAVVTAIGNIPINNQIETWTPAAPPSNWSHLAIVWWQYQSIRTIASVVALALVIIAILGFRGAPET